MNSPAWNFLLIILFILSLALRHELLFFFAILLALASLASRLWMRYCLEAVTYKRTLGNTRLNFGEETDLTIEVTNAKLLPLAWLMALDKYPQDVTLLTKRPDKDEPQIRFLSNLMALRWYERVRRIYRIRGDKRGEFVFGPADVTSGDVFGFAWRHKDAPETDTLLVYPKIVPIGRLGLPPAWPARRGKGRLSSDRRPVAHGDGARICPRRQYASPALESHGAAQSAANPRSLTLGPAGYCTFSPTCKPPPIPIHSHQNTWNWSSRPPPRLPCMRSRRIRRSRFIPTAASKARPIAFIYLPAATPRRLPRYWNPWRGWMPSGNKRWAIYCSSIRATCPMVAPWWSSPLCPAKRS